MLKKTRLTVLRLADRERSERRRPAVLWTGRRPPSRRTTRRLGAALSVAALLLTSAPALGQADEALIVGVEVPSSVGPNRGLTARIAVRNVGTSTWTRSAGYKLGSAEPRDNVVWGENRAELRRRDRVVPGDTKVFEMRLLAPSSDGDYSFRWQMLREGVAWFGDESPELTIRVGGGGQVTPSPVPQPPSSPAPERRELVELVLAGYQGWFTAPGDGVLDRWSHWSAGQAPRPGRVTFELYPDMGEYARSDTFRTGLGPLGDGRASRLFASGRDGVLDVHFGWMRQYGIDGVALQRFVGELEDRSLRRFRNDMALKVRRAAERHQRYFHLTYDITGAPENRWLDRIVWDWPNVVEGRLGLTASEWYVRQDGKPVVEIWGLGFSDRPGDPGRAIELIRWLKGRGLFVIGGVPYYWRNSVADSKPGWQSVYREFDMIRPWSVGRYSSDADLQAHQEEILIPDRAHAESLGVRYQRVIYPGHAWSNWNGGDRNLIPRRAGSFLWRQAYLAKEAGVGVFVAMFDEFDEATAIAKAAEDASQIPRSQYFLTLDADGVALPSDHYLWLTGEIGRLLRDEVEGSWEPPTR